MSTANPRGRSRQGDPYADAAPHRPAGTLPPERGPAGTPDRPNGPSRPARDRSWPSGSTNDRDRPAHGSAERDRTAREWADRVPPSLGSTERDRPARGPVDRDRPARGSNDAGRSAHGRGDRSHPAPGRDPTSSRPSVRHPRGEAPTPAGDETPADAVAIVEAEVRELIRRRGVDPLREPEAVHDLIDQTLADYDERSLRGAVPLLTDHAEARRAVHDAVAGFGPLQRYLDDPRVEELWIDEPAKVFVARDGISELTTTILTADQVRDLVEQMLTLSGRRLDRSSPFVDAQLPGGHRLHVVIPDITEHWAVNVRKYVVRATRLGDLVALGSLGVRPARFLDAAVAAGLNILVAGATQAGKTTMLNALAGSIPPRQRVVICEEVRELRLAVRDQVAMQCRGPSLEGTGEVTLRRLVKEALRMRPDRIVIGEVREAESLDMLIALNAGIPGMCSLHANSAREAIVKMSTLPLLAGENVTSQFVVPTVAAAIDLVLHLGLDADGVRRVREITAVTGRVESGVVETATIYHRPHGQGAPMARGDGFPPHTARFEALGLDLADLLRPGEEP